MNAKVIRLDDCRLTPNPLQIRAAVEAEEDARLREYDRWRDLYRLRDMQREREVRRDEDGIYWTREERK